MGRWFPLICWAALVMLLAVVPQAPAAEDPALRLAGRIDRALEVVWKARQVQPATPATDAEFLRRISLDLAGCVPTADDVRAFLADTAPDKRARAVNRILAGPGHVHHQTNLWRELLMPPGTAREVPRWRLDLETWLREQFRRDVPYDRMVRELLTTPVGISAEIPNGRPDRPHEPTPLSFYRVAEFKADNLAAQTARVFLGINLECAQCHNHPFAAWKKEDFAAFAAFFAGVQPTRMQSGRVVAAMEVPDRRTFVLGTGPAVPARFLDHTDPRWAEKSSGRVVLADWVVDPHNPFFARQAVSRLWDQLFGAPLLDEDDDTFKDLLDVLATAFVESKYDVKLLLRGITASRAYQLSSESSAGESPERVEVFARMRVRGLTGEQMYDSYVRAAGLREAVASPLRADFLARFNQPGEKPSDRQTSILQALALLNGSFLAAATDPARNPFLAAVAEAPWLDTAGQVEALFLTTYSRPPRPAERARWVAYLESSKDRKQALADLLWVLLNSSEFLFNR
jgi:hypothetical protein